MNGEGFRIDTNWSGIVKWGGLMLFLAGLVPIFFVAGVIGTGQELPAPAEEMLEDPTTPTALFSLAVIGEFFLLPGALALYFGLKGIRKSATFMATAIYAVSATLFIGSRASLLAITRLSDSYADATSEAIRGAYVAAAELAIETQNMYAAIALVILCIASIMYGAVMLKGRFGGRIGYVVIAAGVITIPTPFIVMMGGAPILAFIGLVLTAVWQAIVGFKLFKMGTNV